MNNNPQSTSLSDLVSPVVEKIISTISDTMNKFDIHRAAEMIDEALQRSTARMSDDYANIQNRHYPQEYLVLYFLTAIDTVFDCFAQAFEDCRGYLSNRVMDFFEKK